MLESTVIDVSQVKAIQVWIFHTRADFYIGVPAGFLAASAMMIFACFKRAPRYLWSIAILLFSLPLLVVVFAQDQPSLAQFLAVVVCCGFLALVRPPNPQRWYTRLAVATISLAILTAMLLYLAVILCAASGGMGPSCTVLATDFVQQLLSILFGNRAAFHLGVTT